MVDGRRAEGPIARTDAWVVSLRVRDRPATGLSKRQAGRDRHARLNGALRDGGMDDGRGQANGGVPR